jgi:hypothetical protein
MLWAPVGSEVEREGALLSLRQRPGEPARPLDEPVVVAAPLADQSEVTPGSADVDDAPSRACDDRGEVGVIRVVRERSQPGLDQTEGVVGLPQLEQAEGDPLGERP